MTTRERPILMSAPMVRAILSGSKTQTRRALKQQPLDIIPMKGNKRGVEWVTLESRDPKPSGRVVRCRLGVPGDRLWVREAFGHFERNDALKPGDVLFYRADGECVAIEPWRPSIHMPRWASRITLEITKVRAQRLQDISFDDALAEGMYDFRPAIEEECRKDGIETADQCARRLRWPQRQYAHLWDRINGTGSWDKNPWVWAISFRRV